jgi:hypothetical protein
MRCQFLIIAVLALLAAQVVDAQGPKASNDSSSEAVDTMKAMGRALGIGYHNSTPDIVSLEFWANGTSYVNAAGKPGPASKLMDCHASIEYNAPLGMRADCVRDGRRQIEVISIDGNQRSDRQYAWNESEPEGGTITPTLDALADRWLKFWTLTPQAVMKAALQVADSVKVSNVRGATVVTFPLPNASCRETSASHITNSCQSEKIIFTVTLDSKNLIQKVETRARSLATETTYSDYRDLSESHSGKLFPAHIVQKRAGQPYLELIVTKVDPDFPPVYIGIPDSVREAVTQQAAPR